ncbi:alpha-D-ribose 1-methylphosphonate 5-triphosphate diphosphatase [Halotalea alkalilenta]|uniref:Phosphonate metabolism protein PhnM n=1 Tax=Halotalea alkalilenta TaxID=376489 RepID=A0A172YEH0_9GAMM|nr:alpha-D-ribose 1-methylphosphonate 5-triphosphate diphosphatase [Halotalea alkalilenta]ANF57365.1 phosphonate metabolism protein PhnM [Halotalea alkalilenta]
MSETILSNARLVLDDEVVLGSLLIRDAAIGGISLGASRAPGAIDCDGDLLLPGLVELHTDNMERYFQPRPKVAWPGRQAAVAHDAQIAASGITTVFDAVTIGDHGVDGVRGDGVGAMVEALEALVERGLARVDHRLHLRCEVSAPNALARFEALSARSRVGLVSLMDHAPGQRQFVSLDAYRTYYQGKLGLTPKALEALIETQLGNSQRYAAAHRTLIAEHCRRVGLTLASHDDATVEHVDEGLALGVGICEFPTTREAAEAAHRAGLAVVMGAPNVVRGGSHSGNIGASELAAAGHLDVLSSDYYPASLLDALFGIVDAGIGFDLPRALALGSAAPARAVGLDDRGRLAEGLRADLLRVRLIDGHPAIQRVWCQGRQVH